MGILNPLYDAVSWIIVQFHSLYGLVFNPDSGWAWGLSIVSLVVLIRTALIPLFVKQIKSTRNMQVLQPKMKAIQERYKNDRQKQSEEMMKLYKETGTNPLSSCLPILVQSPFFFALYHVLSNVAKGNEVGVIHHNLVDSASKAHIFGAPLPAKFLDSTATLARLHTSVAEVRTVTIIMIVLMSFSQFYTQRQLMTKNVDMSVNTPFMQQQKMLMYVFPLVFAGFGIIAPVGVLLYWLTTNVWTMCQQLVVIRRNPTPGSLAFKQRQERLRAKGKLVEPPEEVKAKEAVEQARANRTQPKRQSKSQRTSGGTATSTHTGGGAGGQKVDDEKPSSTSGQQPSRGGAKSSGSTPSGKSSGGSGASKSSGGGKGAPRAGAPRAGGSKQGGGASGKQSGSSKSKPGNLSKKK
ncbi:YidC/Oxa1 family membrane protein insertase [Actinacidiphila yanglinensis]|uniref:Membrane protein insertase YidC n=1 Tax=Actinacidiphila yanglinensis TaxID=310779 RepID=A0A1H6A558_9ACTN|nr:membrane protein insertase YidC [Actinacidiphila yanglinensis]SEG43869.1 YidC/Oxa1 family membrane protein insertase [Actinacidiphila yanglinensis]